ncbi:C2 domain-containing protein [Citrus sinensis]|uniref:C2 domain-containing protein n=1 Tax=Citrus sinensis TaxID=2711 RepID=A0ACB8I8H6_CITSI|nr:C2 domain-containing protein [Citrus sinensis]
MASYRALDLNVNSAKHLKDVHFISKMEVYAVVSISGDHTIKKQKVKTQADPSGGSNPTWNFPIKFTFNESLAQQNRLTLDFKIKSDGLLGDKTIGEVIIPIKELLDSSSSSSGDAKSMKFVTYQVCSSSEKPKGELHFSYKFSEPTVGKTHAKADEPVIAYPAPMAAGSSSVPYAYPPQPQAGYGYPPQPPQVAAPNGAYPPQQPGYGYPPPPPQQGYGYPPAPQQGYGYPPPSPQQGYEELLDSSSSSSSGDAISMKFVTYQVRSSLEKPKGELHFSYKFNEPTVGKTHAKAGEPMTAYPAPMAAGSSSVPYAYPPLPQARYGYPPQPSQGAAPNGAYPPQQRGYGYPPPLPQRGYGYLPAPQQGYGYSTPLPQ